MREVKSYGGASGGGARSNTIVAATIAMLEQKQRQQQQQQKRPLIGVAGEVTRTSLRRTSSAPQTRVFAVKPYTSDSDSAKKCESNERREFEDNSVSKSGVEHHSPTAFVKYSRLRDQNVEETNSGVKEQSAFVKFTKSSVNSDLKQNVDVTRNDSEMSLFLDEDDNETVSVKSLNNNQNIGESEIKNRNGGSITAISFDNNSLTKRNIVYDHKNTCDSNNVKELRRPEQRWPGNDGDVDEISISLQSPVTEATREGSGPEGNKDWFDSSDEFSKLMTSSTRNDRSYSPLMVDYESDDKNRDRRQIDSPPLMVDYESDYKNRDKKQIDSPKRYLSPSEDDKQLERRFFDSNCSPDVDQSRRSVNDVDSKISVEQESVDLLFVNQSEVVRRSMDYSRGVSATDGSVATSRNRERPESTSDEVSITVCSEEEDDSVDSSGDSQSSSGSSSSSSDDDDSSISDGRELVMDDEIVGSGSGRGLEPITEEERPVTSAASSLNNTAEEGGDESSPDDESTLKASNINTWSGSTSRHGTSTSDLSSSSSSGRNGCGDQNISAAVPYKPSKDNSTCCDEDFQWIQNTTKRDDPYRSQQAHAPSPELSPHNRSTDSDMQSNPTLTTKPPCRPPLRNRTDSSPRRYASDKSAPGSLDRRRIHHPNRQDRDQRSRSTHVGKYNQEQQQQHKSPEREFHFPPPPPRCELSPTRCDYSSCHGRCEVPSPCYDSFHKHHERSDPKRYGSSSMLTDGGSNQRIHDHNRLGSHPDLYNTNSSEYHYGYRYNNNSRDVARYGCCAYHTLPPTCCHCYGGNAADSRTYNWNNYKTQEQDEKVRRLQNEKESLQLQVSVLSEQIDAQSEKISELEKMLNEKKQLLGNAEDLLQREMLSRSSLETQKLELMSAMSELKLQQAALERENVELRTSHYNNNPLTNSITGHLKKPPLMPRTSPIPQQTSTPVHAGSPLTVLSSSPSSILNASVLRQSPVQQADNTQNQQDIPPPRTPPANYRRTVDVHYGSLPRQTFASNGRIDGNANTQTPPTGTANITRKGVVFGRGITSLLGSTRGKGQSVPNLAETESVVIDSTDGTNSYSPQQSPSLQINKSKGLKKILGRMKRSGSENLDDLPSEGEFRRGGVRATASARLGWSEPQEQKRPDIPFSEWDTDTICDWIQDLGLECYITEAKRWVKNGAQLQSASAHDLEKELGIKNVLHRKKLQLAVLDVTDNGTSDPHLTTAGKLDTAWVLRWLDDTGLPQHKEAFLNGRVDGRLLHRLTVDDLAALHVTSLLHATSLRRGIQVLREQSFDPNCLVRRSAPEEPTPPDPKQISVWTAHRVMEWLRMVDLAEYAPNLRGAGVHGALMVLEPKFTGELLATLLNIPPSKTLLRRHLSTHFKELLGRDVIQEKREAEATLGYVPLTPAAKLKVAKKSQFSLKRKKSKGELDYGDLVCPLSNMNGAALSDDEENRSKGRGCLSSH